MSFQIQISQQALNEIFIIPITIEVFLYGIFVVLFSLSLYVFRTKVMPGMLYVIATLIFFTLATISIPVDLVGRYDGVTSDSIQQETDVWKIQSVPYFIFAVTGLQSGALNPIFLSIWVAAAYLPAEPSLHFFLTPCALTQVFGISSTIIVLSIGIGLASDSRTRVFDEENQAGLVSENLEESDSYAEISKPLYPIQPIN
ncbi:hypothetical protein BDP27DRAFT_1428040 [Rhodocollybia butyracea]|uniref:Uncharacterized protein n=1 Tax=Rhodocollybia butyracea TaxID=206335 RepID=A0A9P5PHS7_9AGAR|nr:hypothetical protein BDP27DRAFT_1428040 [Rhodocollybia butyracea]